MFDPNFYPTPPEVIDLMDIECRGKVALEPQAGSGNIVDWLKLHGVKEVLVCEKHPELAEIAKTKGRFLQHDFLKLSPEKISHVQPIVMNPPFNNADKHILHAWEIAPPGCEIVTLCNWSTISNEYTRRREQLGRLIEDHGACDNLGNCFSTAERKTKIEIGLVRLFKPGSGDTEFEGFFMDDGEEEEEEEPAAGNGIMRFDAVRDIVQRYVHSVKCYEEHELISEKMRKLVAPFKVGTFSFSIGYDDTVTTKEEFKKELQKKAWQYLFDKMDMKKYVTSGVMNDINKFVERQQNFPFTMPNVYKMFQIIVGTKEQTFNRALVDAIDQFTKYTHENRYALEGWKTNAGHLLNKKFIINYACKVGYRGELEVSYGGRNDQLTDLTKVLCSITGTSFDNFPSLYNYIHDKHHLYTTCGKHVTSSNDQDRSNYWVKEKEEELKKKGMTLRAEYERRPDIEFGQWFSWAFFEIKGYKKGTFHIKFKDEQHWSLLNQRYAKIKGAVLPEKL